jgi:hypothetical protein
MGKYGHRSISDADREVEIFNVLLRSNDLNEIWEGKRKSFMSIKLIFLR